MLVCPLLREVYSFVVTTFQNAGCWVFWDIENSPFSMSLLTMNGKKKKNTWCYYVGNSRKSITMWSVRSCFSSSQNFMTNLMSGSCPSSVVSRPWVSVVCSLFQLFGFKKNKSLRPDLGETWPTTIDLSPILDVSPSVEAAEQETNGRQVSCRVPAATPPHSLLTQIT